MNFRNGSALLVLATLILGCASPLQAQLKGQWAPGQFGLNAGVIPDPGFTYANLAMNYSASQLNDSNGNRILQNVTGTYSFWVDENILRPETQVPRRILHALYFGEHRERFPGG